MNSNAADDSAKIAQPYERTGTETGHFKITPGHVQPLEEAEIPQDIKHLFMRLSNALAGERIAVDTHIRPMERTCPQCLNLRQTTESVIRQLKLRYEEVVLQRDGARSALRKTMARMPDMIANPEGTHGSG